MGVSSNLPEVFVLANRQDTFDMASIAVGTPSYVSGLVERKRRHLCCVQDGSEIIAGSGHDHRTVTIACIPTEREGDAEYSRPPVS